ncbi:hypothetical protein BB561_003848 [Smittium simulii]|uniref:Uncharacterized protein n=1 Tax=Smittium simulii TaxID=133385 RepID=A0A2T9YJ89_9FUNG|nr:hypothetical protein BB561_003848 [Smittium simulii]
MQNTFEVAESHGIFQFTNSENPTIPSEQNSDSFVEFSLDQDIFQSKKQQKRVLLSEINYVPKYETDYWYEKHSSMDIAAWLKTKNGPTEIKYLAERYYLEKQYSKAFELSAKYIEELVKNGKIKLKGLITRELLEIVSLCLSKLGRYSEAAEYAKLHQELKNRDPGHLYFRGNIYREASLFLDSALEYKAYLDVRKQDPQVWYYLGIDVSAIYQDLKRSDFLNSQLFQDKNPKNLPNNQLPFMNSLLQYLSVLLALGCQLKAFSILNDCGTWSTVDFALKKQQKHLDQNRAEILKCVNEFHAIKQNCALDFTENSFYIDNDVHNTCKRIYQCILDNLNITDCKITFQDFVMLEKEIDLVFSSITQLLGIDNKKIDSGDNIISVYAWIIKNLFLTRGKSIDHDIIDRTVEDL